MAERKKISYKAIIGVAAILDVITIIPVTGDFLAPMFWILITIYLWKKGRGIINARRLATSGISLVAELIPVVQAFPALTLGSVVLTMILKAEDSDLPVNTTRTKNADGVRTPEATQPLNQGGVRLPPKDAMVE
jgi:hypothetical protein